MRILTIKATPNGISLASPTATLGETPSGACIYQINNVPDIPIDEALQRLQTVALPWKRFQIDWTECQEGVNLTFK